MLATERPANHFTNQTLVRPTECGTDRLLHSVKPAEYRSDRPNAKHTHEFGCSRRAPVNDYMFLLTGGPKNSPTPHIQSFLFSSETSSRRATLSAVMHAYWSGAERTHARLRLHT